MVAGPFLNKTVNKLLKSVQNWKSYFEYAQPPFFMELGVYIYIDLIENMLSAKICLLVSVIANELSVIKRKSK